MKKRSTKEEENINTNSKDENSFPKNENPKTEDNKNSNGKKNEKKGSWQRLREMYSGVMGRLDIHHVYTLASSIVAAIVLTLNIESLLLVWICIREYRIWINIR